MSFWLILGNVIAKRILANYFDSQFVHSMNYPLWDFQSTAKYYLFSKVEDTFHHYYGYMWRQVFGGEKSYLTANQPKHKGLEGEMYTLAKHLLSGVFGTKTQRKVRVIPIPAGRLCKN